MFFQTGVKMAYLDFINLLDKLFGISFALEFLWWIFESIYLNSENHYTAARSNSFIRDK